LFVLRPSRISVISVKELATGVPLAAPIREPDEGLRRQKNRAVPPGELAELPRAVERSSKGVPTA